MIMKKLLFFATALLMLFATDSFAKPKPKEKEFYLDKDKLIRYYGFAVKKIPAGEGTIYDRHGEYKITLSGTFDGNIVKNARLTVSHPKNEVQYKGEQVEFKYSQDTVAYILGKGTLSLPFEWNAYEEHIKDTMIAYTNGNVINSAYKNGTLRTILKHEEQLEYEYKYKLRDIDSPREWIFMAFCGSVPSLMKTLTARLYVDFRRGDIDKKLSGPLVWEDGTTAKIGPIELNYHGYNQYSGGIKVPWINFANGDILSETHIRKTMDGGIVEVVENQHEVLLPDTLDQYNKMRKDRGGHYYEGLKVMPFDGYHHRFSESKVIFHIRYSDGSQYDGRIDKKWEHVWDKEILGMKTVPDSSLYTTGIFKSAEGEYSLYYIASLSSYEISHPKEVKYPGYRGNSIFHETFDEFIKNSLQAQIDDDEYKAEQERLEREEQERQEKEAKEREDKLVRTYGKYYTEFRDNGKILLGAPIKMFKELTTVKLQINRRDLQVYEVWYGDSFYDYMYCEVNPKTGKVTGTRPNPWNE